MSFDTIILNGCPKKVWFDLQYGLVFTASKKQKKQNSYVVLVLSVI